LPWAMAPVFHDAGTGTRRWSVGDGHRPGARRGVMHERGYSASVRVRVRMYGTIPAGEHADQPNTHPPTGTGHRPPATGGGRHSTLVRPGDAGRQRRGRNERWHHAFLPCSRSPAWPAGPDRDARALSNRELGSKASGVEWWTDP